VENQMPHTAGPRAAEPSAPAGRIHRDARGGFTLVELLAAAAIVVLIAAVAVPVMMQALAKARNTAIKAEIDMLHMAIMNYKNEYGSFPPALSDFDDANDPAIKHLKRLFPRCANVANEFTGWNTVTPANAMVAWLSGYSADPTHPITGSGGRKKLYDFEQGRITNALAYHAPGKPNAPYFYVNSAFYDAPPPGMPEFTSPNPVPLFVHVYPDKVLNGVNRVVPPWVASLPPERQALWFFTVSTDPNERRHQRPFNPETFQLLNPGRDEEFGTDDDLSNFWPGTRKEYLDSL
jgi:prepilin-type N-terminal cleavage/methylation domain-containing protein